MNEQILWQYGFWEFSNGEYKSRIMIISHHILVQLKKKYIDLIQNNLYLIMLYNISTKDYISYLLSTLLKEASLSAKPQFVKSNFTHHEEPITHFRNSFWNWSGLFLRSKSGT